MAKLKSVRRVYLGKRRQAFERDSPITTQWHGKQGEEPGTALPSDFPFLALLAAGFYTTVEDLDGADTDELRLYVGLSLRDATAVLTALTPLL